MIKRITAKKIFEKHLEVKKQLWGGEFWSDGFFVNSVSKFGSENIISKYVRNQGIEKEYKKLHCRQISLF
jgi:REP element-mobilizing transposase RayT